jgi:hypothetical protein
MHTASDGWVQAIDCNANVTADRVSVVTAGRSDGFAARTADGACMQSNIGDASVCTSDGRAQLTGPAGSLTVDDVRAFLSCLLALGAGISFDSADQSIGGPLYSANAAGPITCRRLVIEGVSQGDASGDVTPQDFRQVQIYRLTGDVDVQPWRHAGFDANRAVSVDELVFYQDGSGGHALTFDAAFRDTTGYTTINQTAGVATHFLIHRRIDGNGDSVQTIIQRWEETSFTP